MNSWTGAWSVCVLVVHRAVGGAHRARVHGLSRSPLLPRSSFCCSSFAKHRIHMQCLGYKLMLELLFYNMLYHIATIVLHSFGQIELNRIELNVYTSCWGGWTHGWYLLLRRLKIYAYPTADPAGRLNYTDPICTAFWKATAEEKEAALAALQKYDSIADPGSRKRFLQCFKENGSKDLKWACEFKATLIDI